MRTILISIFSFLMALGLSSCSKGDMYSTGDGGAQYEIAASFDGGAASRTTIDRDNNPHWVVGDMVWISTGDPLTATCGTVASVEEKTGIARIVTSLDLSGKTVYAVYPYSGDDACSVDPDGRIMFGIPPEQSGKFEEANICAAVGDVSAGLRFKNVTSVFKIEGRTSDVGKMLFEKTGVCGSYAFDCTTMEVVPVDAADAVTAKPESGTYGPYYVAVAPGLTYQKDEAIARYCKLNGACLRTKTTKNGLGPLERSRIYNLGTTYVTIDADITL